MTPLAIPRCSTRATIIAAILAIGLGAPPAAEAQTRPCSFEAFVIDRGPAARVHAAPNARAPVLLELTAPPAAARSERRPSHTLALSGQAGEWYRVAEILREDGSAVALDWSGEAFIHRSRIRVVLRSEARLYAGPDGAQGIAGIVRRAVAAVPLACRERALRVSIATAEGRVDGWVSEEFWCGLQAGGCILGAAE